MDLSIARDELGCPRKPRGGKPWAFAAQLVLMLNGLALSGDAEDDDHRAQLGRSEGRCFLADLYPLPLRSGKFDEHYVKRDTWPNVKQYRAEVGARRAKWLAARWRDRHPRPQMS